MAFAKYTIEVFCQLGDEDNPDRDAWSVHQGKGGTAAGHLSAEINSNTYAGTVRALKREIVDEVPQWLTEEPVLVDDPNPQAALVADLIASRRLLLGSDNPT